MSVKEAQKNIKKNIIVCIGAPITAAMTTLEVIKKDLKGYRWLLLYPKKFDGKENQDVLKAYDFAVPCNYDSSESIIKALLPYKNEIKAIHNRAEVNVPSFAKIIPFVPYTRTPTTESLDWSVNKLKMRKRFFAHNKKITPKFTYVNDTTKSTLDRIEKTIGFPLVIKPTDLAQSLLVTNVYHREELDKSLKTVFKKIVKVYKESGRTVEPGVLVEEFMDGKIYSIDGYVTSRGSITFCPMVQVKTGKEIGFDDFFGYQQMTPTTLSKEYIDSAEYVAKEGVQALGLRSSAFHAELMKTDSGWKIIEIGARIGGFRHELYEYSYGFNHRANSVKVAIPQKVSVSKKVRGYSAAMKIFAQKEGTIRSIQGVKRIQELASVKSISQNLKTGDKAVFAAKGGKSVVNIILFNKERAKLLADIRRLEKELIIKTSKIPRV